MRLHVGVLVITAVLCLLVVSPGAAQTPDPLAGEWELDVAKSMFSPGPPPKSVHLKVESTGKSVKATTEQVTAEGKTLRTEFTAMNDGKDYPITGSPFADTVSLTASGNTRNRVDKKGGKVVMTYQGSVSADGQVFTVQQKGTGPKGEAVNNTLVFRRH